MSVFEHTSVSFLVAFVLAVSQHVRSAYVTSFQSATLDATQAEATGEATAVIKRTDDFIANLAENSKF